MLKSETITITYVFWVKTSIKATNWELRTSMLWNCDWVLLYAMTKSANRHHYKPAAQLELLDDIGNLFESVSIVVGSRGRVCYDEKGGSFEEHHLICFTYIAKVGEASFQFFDIWNQRVHNRRPRLTIIQSNSRHHSESRYPHRCDTMTQTYL